jgi:hypothetical protein
MNFTQNEKISQVTYETLVVGIDISSETYYVRAFDFRGREVGKLFKFCSDILGFADFMAWIDKVKSQTGITSVIIGAEPTAEYWFTLAEYLKDKELRFVFVVQCTLNEQKSLTITTQAKQTARTQKL